MTVSKSVERAKKRVEQLEIQLREAKEKERAALANARKKRQQQIRKDRTRGDILIGAYFRQWLGTQECFNHMQKVKEGSELFEDQQFLTRQSDLDLFARMIDLEKQEK